MAFPLSFVAALGTHLMSTCLRGGTRREPGTSRQRLRVVGEGTGAFASSWRWHVGQSAAKGRALARRWPEMGERQRSQRPVASLVEPSERLVDSLQGVEGPLHERHLEVTSRFLESGLSGILHRFRFGRERTQQAEPSNHLRLEVF